MVNRSFAIEDMCAGAAFRINSNQSPLNNLLNMTADTLTFQLDLQAILLGTNF